jgi:hypothetical protein
MGYLPHLITFLLLSMVMFVATTNLFCIHRAHQSVILRQLLVTLCCLQLLVMFAFAYNQMGWIINEHESIVGQDAQIGWLAYDYLNKLFHLITALTLRYYLDFKQVDPCSENRRRASDD